MTKPASHIFQISSTVLTLSAKNMLVENFQNIIDKYHSNKNIKNVYKKYLSTDQVLAFEFDISENKIDIYKEQLFKDFVLKIVLELDHLTVVNITAAIESSNVFLMVISDWFCELYNSHCILNWVVEPSLIAGCVIECNGKYFDLSLNNTLKNLSTI